jgi:hypothetical protein
MCLWRAPEKYIAGAALDRAALESQRRMRPPETERDFSKKSRISDLKILTNHPLVPWSTGFLLKQAVAKQINATPSLYGSAMFNIVSQTIATVLFLERKEPNLHPHILISLGYLLIHYRARIFLRQQCVPFPSDIPCAPRPLTVNEWPKPQSR